MTIYGVLQHCNIDFGIALSPILYQAIAQANADDLVGQKNAKGFYQENAFEDVFCKM